MHDQIEEMVEAAARAQRRAMALTFLGVIGIGIPVSWTMIGFLYMGIFTPNNPPMWLLWSSTLMLFTSLLLFLVAITFRAKSWQ